MWESGFKPGCVSCDSLLHFAQPPAQPTPCDSVCVNKCSTSLTKIYVALEHNSVSSDAPCKM